MAAQAPMHAPDGGTSETLQSIDIFPAANVPFSATVVTEWTRILPDGSTQTTKNHRIVARDSSGRVFQERRYFSPNGDQQETPLSELDYQYPNQHQLYVCRPEIRVCTVYRYNPPLAILTPKAGTLSSGTGSVTVEDLGRKTIENLEVFGSREVTTINAGVAGNQRSEPTVKEFWYSPRLQINLVTKRFDPHVSGIQDFEVKNINLDDPDPKLFQTPADYRLIRMDEQ
ncbi:MAG: hypothetical protein ACLQM6_02945 [Acidobacteriaceae bacterium]